MRARSRGPFGQALRTGVEEALGRFTSIVENPGADPDAGREVYVNLGRGEMRAGRSLDALLAAYRLGARVAWRRLAAAGERAGLSPRTLYTLAEAIFAYIDELSADSIEGYAREQAAAAGALQRRRQRLAALLVQEPPPPPATVEAAAASAGWRLPRSLAALVVEAEDEQPAAGRPASRPTGSRCGSGPRRSWRTWRRTSSRWSPRRPTAASSSARCADRRAALGPAVAVAGGRA